MEGITWNELGMNKMYLLHLMYSSRLSV